MPYIMRAHIREGAVEAGLHAIKHGTPDDALLAAKYLGLNTRASKFDTTCVEQEGTICAMLMYYYLFLFLSINAIRRLGQMACLL